MDLWDLFYGVVVLVGGTIIGLIALHIDAKYYLGEKISSFVKGQAVPFIKEYTFHWLIGTVFCFAISLVIMSCHIIPELFLGNFHSVWEFGVVLLIFSAFFSGFLLWIHEN